MKFPKISDNTNFMMICIGVSFTAILSEKWFSFRKVDYEIVMNT